MCISSVASLPVQSEGSPILFSSSSRCRMLFLNWKTSYMLSVGL